MKNNSSPMDKHHNIEYEAFKPYVIGFILSIVLTLAAYFLVVGNLFSRWVLISALVGLAILQAGVQVLFFLHLGKGYKPHCDVLTFLLMLLFLAILVLGSMWIMYNLDGRVMPTMER